jgi:hypothetical protein
MHTARCIHKAQVPRGSAVLHDQYVIHAVFDYSAPMAAHYTVTHQHVVDAPQSMFAIHGCTLVMCRVQYVCERTT